jgi:polyisoprenoid-binding protein YceI
VEVPKATWFNVAKFPNATFASTSIKAKGGGKFDVAGKLSVKGTTKDVVVPIALAQAGATTTATGAFAIKRSDFKIGEGEWSDTSTVADDVQVKFKIALTGVGPL